MANSGLPERERIMDEYLGKLIVHAWQLTITMLLMGMTADHKPKLRDLQGSVILDPLACSKWEKVGIELKLADEDDGAALDEIADKFSEDDKRLLEVLKKWLRSSQAGVTWRCLLETLKKLELHGAVAGVESHIGKLAIT